MTGVESVQLCILCGFRITYIAVQIDPKYLQRPNVLALYFSGLWIVQDVRFYGSVNVD